MQTYKTPLPSPLVFRERVLRQVDYDERTVGDVDYRRKFTAAQPVATSPASVLHAEGGTGQRQQPEVCSTLLEICYLHFQASCSPKIKVLGFPGLENSPGKGRGSWEALQKSGM